MVSKLLLIGHNGLVTRVHIHVHVICIAMSHYNVIPGLSSGLGRKTESGDQDPTWRPAADRPGVADLGTTPCN